MHILNPEGILPTYTKISRGFCGFFFVTMQLYFNSSYYYNSYSMHVPPAVSTHFVSEALSI